MRHTAIATQHASTPSHTPVSPSMPWPAESRTPRKSAPNPRSYKICYVKRTPSQPSSDYRKNPIATNTPFPHPTRRRPAFSNTLRAALLACICLGPATTQPALAQNSSIGFGDVYANFQPKLSQPDLDLLLRVLELTESEKQSVQSLYDGYAAGLKEKAREASQQAEKALEEAQTLGDQKFARASRDEFTDAGDKMTEQFLTDLQAMLSSQQAGRWPIAQRELRRREQIGAGRYPGESVDVVRLTEEVAPGAGEQPQIADLIEQYAAQVDGAITARETFIKDNYQRYAELMPTDPAGAERLFEESQRLRLGVRDINRRFAKQIGELLTSEQRDKMQQLFFERSFGFAAHPSRSEEFILAAPKLTSLSDDQRTQLEDIVKAYLPRRDAAIRKVCEEEERVRIDARPSELAKALGKQDSTHDGFSGLKNLPDNHPLVLARRARFDNDRTTRAQVESILTREQADEIPNPLRGVAQFDSLQVHGL